jgi:hypothetical protein
VSGTVFENRTSYCESHNANYSIHKIKSYELLAATFGFTIGNVDTIKHIENAKLSLERVYLIEERSSLDVHKLFHFSCSVSHVSNLMKTLGITRRTKSKAGILACIFNRSSIPVSRKFKTGFHVDWEGKKHHFRSGLEKDFYKKLDDAKLSYESEDKRIAYFDTELSRHRIAVPDISVGNCIFEIKGRYTYDRQNMYDRFTAYQKGGYKTYLVLDKTIIEIVNLEDLPDSKTVTISTKIV